MNLIERTEENVKSFNYEDIEDDEIRKIFYPSSLSLRELSRIKIRNCIQNDNKIVSFLKLIDEISPRLPPLLIKYLQFEDDYQVKQLLSKEESE